MKTIKHYALLGAYFGACALVVAIVRALPELPGKLKNSPGWSDFIDALPLLVVIVAGFLLAGAAIGGLVGWFKLNAEKSARARHESLIVRR